MATAFRQFTGRFSVSSMLTKIIAVNAVVFLALHLVSVVLTLCGRAPLMNAVLSQIELPSDLVSVLRHPWTLVTYMFAQYDLLHFLFNMVWLYWFGQIFLAVSTQRRILALYIYGGLAGALFYLGAYQIFPLFAGTRGMLIGSSAAVIAIVAATAVTVPDYRMRLLFFGEVSLKWVAIVTIALDLIGVSGENAGGHIAHFGGAVLGAVYALLLRRGTDITVPFCRMADLIVNTSRRIFTRPPKPQFRKYSAPKAGAASSRQQDAENQRQLDIILDKIKKSGYSSLTAEERRRLFDVSSRIKQS